MKIDLRRFMFYGLVGVVILLVGVGSLSYVVGRKSPWERQLIPARVSGADEVAQRAIPGWDRAAAQGLVVNLGVTERIPGTEATITLEKGWFSGRQAYLLYTVRAPEGGHLLPTRVWVGRDGEEKIWREGGTDWNHLSTWGGFSAEGFHSVTIFPRFAVPDDVQRLKLTFHHWAPVSPEAGLDQGRSAGSSLSLAIPWQAAFLREPAPQVYAWERQHAWLGRTLALERLEVGIGQVQLTGEITLPEGERKPGFTPRMRVGDQTLEAKEFKAEPTEDPQRYRFTVTYDGPNQWPAKVDLELRGITFETDKTLEWPVNWAKYREYDGSENRLMDEEDQVSVKFYDSELISIYTIHSGVSIEQRDPKGAPPYVRASIGGGGRGIEPEGPGMEVVNDAGEVLTNLGGGGGTIYDNGRDERQGVAVLWWDELPESFRQSERLVIRYVYPSATMVLDERWSFDPGK